MAHRPVFLLNSTAPFYKEIDTEFRFYPGFALSQVQKSILSLHEAYIMNHPEDDGKILEISTKSTQPLGNELSAFNLQYRLSNGDLRPLEAVFQSAKCFENGRQYIDLLNKSPYEIKGDNRLRESGSIISFSLEGEQYPILPRTFFYNWIYIKSVANNTPFIEQLTNYRAFTDIAFNPSKSLNCQARSAAILVSLYIAGKLDKALASQEDFLRILYEDGSV